MHPQPANPAHQRRSSTLTDMEGRSQRIAGPLSRRQKRLMILVGAVLAVVLGGVSAWAATGPGSYDRSRNGCVTVNVASSMGGSVTHRCGAAARDMCRTAFARDDKVSRLTQEQCRLAGIRPPFSPASQPATGG
jgi:hypothetical protein